MNEVKYEPEKSMEPQLHLTLSVVDLVWNAIVGNRRNEQHFLRNDGIFKLLDVFEVAPVALKRHVVGVIADLVHAQDHSAVDQFIQWNSQRTAKCGIRLLLEMWQREQENANAVDGKGVVNELCYPLNPKQTETQAQIPTGYSRGSPLMSPQTGRNQAFPTDPSELKRMRNSSSTSNFAKTYQTNTEEQRLQSAMREDCRARIYAIVAKVGIEGLEAPTVEEYQALEMVHLLPECKVLEQWMAVRQDMSANDMKPLLGDVEWMERAMTELKAKTTKLKDFQTNLIDQTHLLEEEGIASYFADVCRLVKEPETRKKPVGPRNDA